MKPLPPDPDPRPLGWKVVTQDYTGYARGNTKRKKLPPVSTKWFATREAAEAHRRDQRQRYPSVDCLICITPAVKQREKIKEQPKPHHTGQMDWQR